MELDREVLGAINEAARLLKESRYVTALTGAGVSVESGIPPFRGPGGIWMKYGEPPMDGYRRFLEDPKAYWIKLISPERRSHFGESFKEAKPNTGHVAFAELERMGILRALVTQNIDNLHTEAGSIRVIEIHGNRHKLRCIGCNARFPREGFDLSVIPPKCPRCGGIIKDDVVMFGEPIPPDVQQASFEEAKRSDCMIVAGTSAVVHPAAGLPVTVKRRGGYIIQVNPYESDLSEISDISIRAPSGEAMPALVEALRKLA
jgi:NAD-dependent deacetylase